MNRSQAEFKRLPLPCLDGRSRGAALATGLALLFISASAQTPPSTPHDAGDTALEGYVRDEHGHPVKGVRIYLNQGSYTTQGERDVIPIYVPDKVAGVIVFDDPNAINTHIINQHIAMTDGKGYYVFKRLTAGRYHFSAVPLKKAVWSDWFADETKPNKTLAQKYTFPPGGLILVESAKKTRHDVELTSRTSDAAAKR